MRRWGNDIGQVVLTFCALSVVGIFGIPGNLPLQLDKNLIFQTNQTYSPFPIEFGLEYISIALKPETKVSSCVGIGAGSEDRLLTRSPHICNSIDKSSGLWTTKVLAKTLVLDGWDCWVFQHQKPDCQSQKPQRSGFYCLWISRDATLSCAIHFIMLHCTTHRNAFCCCLMHSTVHEHEENAWA